MTNLGTESALDAEHGDIHVELLQYLSEGHCGQCSSADVARFLDICSLELNKAAAQSGGALPSQASGSGVKPNAQGQQAGAAKEKKPAPAQKESKTPKKRTSSSRIQDEEFLEKKNKLSQTKTEYDKSRKDFHNYKVCKQLESKEKQIKKAHEELQKKLQTYKNCAERNNIDIEKNILYLDKQIAGAKLQGKENKQNLAKMNTQKSVEKETEHSKIMEMYTNLKLEKINFETSMELLRVEEEKMKKEIEKVRKNMKMIESTKKRDNMHLKHKLAKLRKKVEEIKKTENERETDLIAQIQKIDEAEAKARQNVDNNIEKLQNELNDKRKELETRLQILASQEREKVTEIQNEITKLNEIKNNKEIEMEEKLKNMEIELVQSTQELKKSIQYFDEVTKEKEIKTRKAIEANKERQEAAKRDMKRRIKEFENQLAEAEKQSHQSIERMQQETKKQEKEFITKALNLNAKENKIKLDIARNKHRQKIEIMKQDEIEKEQQIKAEIEKLKVIEQQIKANIDANIKALKDELAEYSDKIKKEELRSANLFAEREKTIKRTIDAANEAQKKKKQLMEENINKLEIKLIKLKFDVDENCRIMEQSESERKIQIEAELKQYEIQKRQELENTIKRLHDELTSYTDQYNERIKMMQIEEKEKSIEIQTQIKSIIENQAQMENKHRDNLQTLQNSLDQELENNQMKFESMQKIEFDKIKEINDEIQSLKAVIEQADSESNVRIAALEQEYAELKLAYDADIDDINRQEKERREIVEENIKALLNDCALRNEEFEKVMHSLQEKEDKIRKKVEDNIYNFDAAETKRREQHNKIIDGLKQAKDELEKSLHEERGFVTESTLIYRQIPTLRSLTTAIIAQQLNPTPGTSGINRDNVSREEASPPLSPAVDEASLAKDPANNKKTAWLRFCSKGVYTDSQLKWKEELNYIGKAISPACYVLRSLRNDVTIKHLKMVYYALVELRLKHSILFWGGSYDYNIQKAFVIQKIAVRTMVRIQQQESFKPHFTDLNILTVPSLYVSVLLTHLSKYIFEYETEEGSEGRVQEGRIFSYSK